MSLYANMTADEAYERDEEDRRQRELDELDQWDHHHDEECSCCGEDER